MGPLASNDLLGKIIANTDAHSDGEHLHVILDSDTAIPDRTAAILHGGKDPREELCASARRLQTAGAEALIIACNTAHYFYDTIAASVEIPVLHMPRLTAQAVHGEFRKVALLATDGMVQSGIYQKAFERGPQLILPEREQQESVMALIYDGVKRGNAHFPTEKICRTLQELTEKGAEAFVLGCTELPIAFSMYHLPGKTVDPTLILAREAIRFCGGPLKPIDETSLK